MPASQSRTHVAGEGRFDTIVLRALAPSASPRAAPKACIARRCRSSDSGIALKIDDGAKRAAELVMSEVIAALLPEAKLTSPVSSPAKC